MRFLHLVLFPLLLYSQASSQVISFPYTENFDSVTAPALPPGWICSTNRTASGDFFSTATSPHSSPYAIQSTNSVIPQFVVSPVFDFSHRVPDKLKFWIARSGTHASPLVVEVSPDSGLTFPVVLGDTLRNPGTTSYVQTVLSLPESLFHHGAVRFRWSLLGGTGGTSGTLRMDDVEVSSLISIDLAVRNGTLTPSIPTTSDPLSVSLIIYNDGVLTSPDAELRFFLDSNNDRVAASQEQFASLQIPPLVPADSITVSVFHPPLSQGSHRFIGVITLAEDERASNDTSAVEFDIGVTPGAILLNEIMYEPLEGKSEWFELFNPGNIGVDLDRWIFSGAPSPSGSVSTLTIADSMVSVPPGGFAVVSSDSTIFDFSPFPSNVPLLILNKSGLGLSNGGDDIVVKDASGTTIDSVRYSPLWHQPAIADTKGRSLERINPGFGTNEPSNWSTSASRNGGSPGVKNTIFTARVSTTGSLSFSPNPFSPDGDGHEDFCLISYRLPRITALIRATIFDLHGRTIRELTGSQLSGDHGELLWDGLDNEKRRARIGPYIVLLEAIDGRGESAVTLKGVVVVATKL